MFAYHLLTLTCIIAVAAFIWQKWPSTNNITKKLDGYYDYVIVGGGTAGCVLAARLSEDSNIKVALLEAGDEEISYPIADIPLALMDLQQTNADWSYKTVPQNFSCRGMKDEQSVWPSGKILGGSSSIGNMIYVRGNKQDYDNWSDMGCKGWSYEEIMPYFLKAEKNRNSRYAKTKYHGAKGPMVVQDHMATPKLTEAFRQSAISLGYPSLDINGEKQIGVSHNQGNINWGRRVSTASAYLRPVINRPNLHVATLSHATKILFKDTNAVGVEYVRNRTTLQVRARREVIISAGTVQSAQLLLLSGVGPKDQLRAHNIPLVVDLPVGENLQDHIYTDSTIYSFRDPVAITSQRAKGLLTLMDFLVFGHGLLTSAGIEGNSFSRSSIQDEDDPRPHLQLVLLAFLFGNDREKNPSNIKKLNYRDNVYNAIHGHMKEKEGSLLLPVLLHPRSRGNVTLKNSDPFAQPDINPNYLEHMDDVKELVEGIGLSHRVMEAGAFHRLGARRVETRHPHCKEYTYDTDLYWQCYVRQNTLTMHHPVGTCKMGAAKDQSAVVDPQLRVRGVGRLRVVDASVMPNLPSGNINAATVMIAEKAADLIRGKVTVRPWGDDSDEISEIEEHRHKLHGEL